MAAPAVGQHYGDTSIVEDVTDIIYQITPEDTPFFNMTGDTSARAITHEYQVRSILTRQVNAVVEGNTFGFATANQRPTRASNITQIFQKEIRVSGSLQAVDQYAISDQFADQMQISMVGLKTDKEHALIQGTLASGATGTARSLQGILSCIASNLSTYTHGGATVTLTENNFNNFIQTAWDLGGEPRDVLVGGSMKRHISSYTSANTQFIPADQQRIVATISVYESDFFPVQVRLSRDIPADGAPASARYTLAQNGSLFSAYGVLFLDRTMVRKAWLRRVIAERLPKTADSLDGEMTCELTLECGEPGAHAYVENMVGP